MQIIDVLRDDPYVIALLEIDECLVGGIGLGRPHLLPPLVVELEHKGWVFGPRLGRRHILHAVAFPEAAVAAKCLEPALGANPGAGKHDNLFHGDLRAGRE